MQRYTTSDTDHVRRFVFAECGGRHSVALLALALHTMAVCRRLCALILVCVLLSMPDPASAAADAARSRERERKREYRARCAWCFACMALA